MNLSLTTVLICAAVAWVILDKKSFRAVLAVGVCTWIISGVAELFFQDRALREFYGEGNYTTGAADHRTYGNMVGIGAIPELRATYEDNSYSCQHVGIINKPLFGLTDFEKTLPTMSFPDDEAPVCCWMAENQYLVPYKDNGDELHLFCGAWPHNEEVVISPVPEQFRS